MTSLQTRREVVPNPLADKGSVGKSDGVLALGFHRSLPEYAITPLIAAPRLASRLGVASVHVKDESNRLGMPSFKILGASWATLRALADRSERAFDAVDGLDGLRALVAGSGVTLVAATDGNHGRAVARMAGLLDLDAHILVPRDMVPARIEALRAEHARVTVVDGTYDDAVARSSTLADESHIVISDTSWEGYQDVPGWVIDGYSTIVEEVLAELESRGEPPPSVVAVQVGVGAFAAAMVRGFVPQGARLIGVEPTKAACLLESVRAGHPIVLGGELDSIMAGLNCGTPSPIAWSDVSVGIDTFVAVDDSDAEEAMRALSLEGVVSGESGAAALAGLLTFASELGLRADDRVLVISTEGATDPDAYRRIVAGDNAPAGL